MWILFSMIFIVITIDPVLLSACQCFSCWQYWWCKCSCLYLNNQFHSIQSTAKPMLLIFSVSFQNKVLPGTFWWKQRCLGTRLRNTVGLSTLTWWVWGTSLRINLSPHWCWKNPGLAFAETPGITGLTRAVLTSLTGTRASLTTMGAPWNHVPWLTQPQECGLMLTVRQSTILSVKRLKFGTKRHWS